MADENKEVEQLQRLSAAIAGIDSATNTIATTVGDVKTRVQAILDRIKEAAQNPNSTAAITTLAQQAEATLAGLSTVETQLQGIGKEGTGTGEGTGEGTGTGAGEGTGEPGTGTGEGTGTTEQP